MKLNGKHPWFLSWLFFLGACLSLSGCIGSQILFNDDRPQAYGNLADVPEMMSSTPSIPAQQEQARLEQDYDTLLKDHREFSQTTQKKGSPSHG